MVNTRVRILKGRDEKTMIKEQENTAAHDGNLFPPGMIPFRNILFQCVLLLALPGMAIAQTTIAFDWNSQLLLFGERDIALAEH